MHEQCHFQLYYLDLYLQGTHVTVHNKYRILKLHFPQKVHLAYSANFADCAYADKYSDASRFTQA